MELLAEMNRTAQIAKQAVMAAREADVSVYDKERLGDDAEKAMRENAVLVSRFLATAPEVIGIKALDTGSLQAEAEQAAERSAALSRDMYMILTPPEEIKIKELEVQVKDPEIPKHPALTEFEWMGERMRDRARRRVVLYERERFSIQKKLNVTPGTDERKAEVEARLLAWKEKRLAKEARLAERRDGKAERDRQKSMVRKAQQMIDREAWLAAKKEKRTRKVAQKMEKLSKGGLKGSPAVQADTMRRRLEALAKEKFDKWAAKKERKSLENRIRFAGAKRFRGSTLAAWAELQQSSEWKKPASQNTKPQSSSF